MMKLSLFFTEAAEGMGNLTDWVVRELRFGVRKDGNGDPDIRKAEMLMYLARNEVVSNPCHWHAFVMSRCLLNIAKRSLLRLMLSCVGLASKHAAG
jgi:hypothetical protein